MPQLALLRPLGRIAFVVLLLAAPQLIGGVLPASLLIIAGLATFVLACTLLGDTDRRRTLRGGNSWLCLGALLTLGWSSLQVLPLPCRWVAWLSSESVWALRESRRLLALPPPSYCTLSFDPGGTRQALLMLLAAAATFLATARLTQRHGRRWVLRTVATSSVAVGVVTLLHALLGAEAVFGLYTPVYASTAWSPLLNPNNLAGFSLFGAILCVGLSFNEPSPWWRIVWRLGCCLLIALLAFAPSGGALLLALLTLPGMGWLVWRERKARRPSELAWWPVLLIIGAAFGTYLAGEQALQEMRSQDGSKLQLFSDAWRFSRQHAWIGVGKGAFSAAFATFQGNIGRFDYAENLPLQWAIEWGWPFALGLGGLLAGMLLRAWRHTRHQTVYRLALCALLALALHNLVDFSLELPGVAVVAAACLATLTAGLPRWPLRTGHIAWGRLERGLAALTWRRTGYAVLAASVLALTQWSGGLLQANVRHLEQRLNGLPGASPAWKQTLRLGFAAHPHEPTLALLAAQTAVLHHAADSDAWLRFAQRLAPGWSGPWLLRAEWSFAQGDAAAAAHALLQAATREPARAAWLHCRLIAAGLTPLARLSALSFTDRLTFLQHTSACLPPDSFVAAWADDELLRWDVDAPLPHLRYATRLLAEGRHRAAIDQLARLRRAADVGTRRQAWQLTASAYAQAGDAAGMRAAVAEIRRQAAGDVAALAASEVLRGDLEQLLHNPSQALAAWENAQRLLPQEAVLLRIAQAAAALQMSTLAYESYSRLCDSADRSDPYCRERDAWLSKAH